jgi:hypothetical protein
MYNLTVDDAHTFFVGEQAWLVHNWCVGDPIDALDPITGASPSWPVVRARYWRTEAVMRGTEYTDSNVVRMSQGLPPEALVEISTSSGNIEQRWISMELHHWNGRAGNLMSDIDNLLPVWPWEHESFDANRSIGYTFVRIIIDAVKP